MLNEIEIKYSQLFFFQLKPCSFSQYEFYLMNSSIMELIQIHQNLCEN